MSTKSGLKKTFSWRFGPSKFSRKSKSHSETEDESDSRRHNNAFPFHSQQLPSEADRDFSKESGTSTVGFISDILDGVVFTPVGASELPRPSPDTRCRSTLSSFRPPETEEANQQQEQRQEPQQHQTLKPSVSNKLELIKAIRTKSPPPPDLETLFQRELAAKIRKRCLDSLQREQEESSPAVSNPPSTRSTQSALPPIPKAVVNTVVDTSHPVDSSLGEFDNPLYQTLDECYSEPTSPPPPPPLPLDASNSEAGYAVIDEPNSLAHYQTIISGAAVDQAEEEERVYAQVADDLTEERIYDIADKSFTDTASLGDVIYENLEEFKEQTYANILEDSSRSKNVLTALVLDVDAAVASSSNSRSSNCSSSGNSSSPQQSSSSPEQLSPTDSLANVSVGSVRSVGTPDSGVFGLLKPADYSDTSMIEEKNNSSDQADLLDRTLKQFEQLEQMSMFNSSPKQSKTEMNDSGVVLTQPEEKVSGSEELVSPVVLEAKAEEKMVPISEIPIAQLLEMAGTVVPSDVNATNSDENEDVNEQEPPRMPMSPPPLNSAPEDDLYLASLVSVDSQGSSMTTSSASADSIRSVRSPEPKMNIGAKIVEDQVKKMQELEHARNEKLGLEDIGESYEKLNSSRYDVINEMTPKKAKRAVWLTSTAEEDSNQQEPSADLKSQPLDGVSRPGGVNNESILVKKEETKAFWEGKMQSEAEDNLPVTSGRNHRMKAEQQIQRQAALSPPPGFDNDTVDGHVASFEPELNEEPVLGSMDFIDVASITFKGDPEEETESKPFVVFGSFDDSHIDVVEAEPMAPLSLAPTATASIQTEKPQRSRDVRPKPLYFEPDRASSSSDNEFEPDSPASFSSGRGTHGSHPNPTETLIEREIRLQREREEAVLRERQKALEILEATRKQTKATEPTPRKSSPAESNKKEGIKSHSPAASVGTQSASELVVKKTNPVETKKSTEMLISPAEIRISEEIRELKRREEELRQLREANARNHHQMNNEDPTSFITTTSAGVTDDEGLYSDAERDVSSSEANSSRVESPEAGMIPNEYSKFPHQRTQSMDSMSSGHSSGDHAVAPINNNISSNTSEAAKRARANKPVMPLENLSDQEETPAYLGGLQETPIEREIRLGREREEALRREKGLQAQPGVTAGATKQNDKEKRQGQRLVNGGNDQRDVQHRYATSIIQREMEEIAERENELVRAGKIQTTSIERADSKVSTLGDYSKKKTVAPMAVNNKTPVAVHLQEPSFNRSESVTNGRESPIEIQAKKPPQMKVAYANRGYGNVSGAPAAASATWRNFGNPQGAQRGLMEKFFMSRGRINTPSTFNNTTSSTPSLSLPSASHNTVTPGSSTGDSVGVIKPVRYLPPAVKPVEFQAVRKDQNEEDEYREKIVPPRRHYATTEEKIQQEFREMQKREEELKLNRSKFFAKSQPNLLDMDDGVSEPEQNMGSLRSAHSISDLLADEPQSVEMREDSLPMASSSTVKGARRKSALIAQWENRIHQQDF